MSTKFRTKQVCAEPRTSAYDMTLPALCCTVASISAAGARAGENWLQYVAAAIDRRDSVRIREC